MSARLLVVLGLTAVLGAGCQTLDALREAEAAREGLAATDVTEADLAASEPALERDAEADVEQEPADEQVTELEPATPLGLPGIELHTPPAGGGPRPVLAWSSVPDATSYLVVLRAGVDAPASWVWRGTATEVQVGLTDLPGLGGPEVEAGMVWSVLALDDDELPVAQSRERPIAP